MRLSSGLLMFLLNDVPRHPLEYAAGACVFIAAVASWFLYSRVMLGVCNCYCGPGKCECECGCRDKCPCYFRNRAEHNEMMHRGRTYRGY